MKKVDFPVGQKVRGYGLLNEYGEFDFIPEQTGARQGQTKLIKSNDEYTLSETKKMVIAHIRLPKGDNKLDLIKKFFGILNNILTDLREYDL